MNSQSRIANRLYLIAVRGVVGLLLVLLAWLVGTVIAHGLTELTRWSFFTEAPNPAGPGGGIGPQLFNTVYILVFSLVLTIPVGVGAGIYFAEYAGEGRLTNLCRRATETLATLPSIVVGLFAFALIVRATNSHPSRLGGALALLVINLPYAVRVTEDALRALPRELREGSLALGATRWQTVTGTLLPAALPSLVTGLVLLCGRAIGEAAAILFAGSGGSVTTTPGVDWSPLANGDTLAVDLYQFRHDANPGVVTDLASYSDGVTAVLVLLVLIVNLGARAVGRLAVRRLQGAST